MEVDDHREGSYERTLGPGNNTPTVEQSPSASYATASTSVTSVSMSLPDGF